MDVPRADHVPTLNEAGAAVLGVDGTDSFAVPGPADGLPADTPEPPAISRTRVLVTVGAVVSGLAFVVAVGTGSGAADPRLRSADGGGGLVVPEWGSRHGGVDAPVLLPARPDDDETLRQLESTGSPVPTLAPYQPYDDDLYRRSTVTTTPATIDVGADDGYDYEVDDADAFPSYRPSYTVPRRTTSPRRNNSVITTPPRVTTSTTATTTAVPTTTTTTAGTTTTLAATTTTLAATTTTQPTTTTTLPPAPGWERLATAGLPAECAVLHLQATDRSLVARAGDAWFRSTDDGAHWAPVDTHDRGPITAIAEPAGATDGAYWFATESGVFDQAGTAVGDVTGVRSLTVRVNQGVPTLLAVTGSGLSRSDGGAWVPVLDDDLIGRALGAARYLPSGVALLGSDSGLLRSIDGLDWTPATTPGGAQVAGEPVVTPAGAIAWLLAGGTGAISSPAASAGATWVASPAIAGGAGLVGVTVLPAGGLLAVDTEGTLLVPSNATWTALVPAPDGDVAGVVRAASSTIAFGPVCGPDAIVRLADAQPNP